MSKHNQPYEMPEFLAEPKEPADIQGNINAFLKRNGDMTAWVGRIRANDQRKLLGHFYGKRVFRLYKRGFDHFVIRNNRPKDVKTFILEKMQPVQEPEKMEEEQQEEETAATERAETEERAEPSKESDMTEETASKLAELLVRTMTMGHGTDEDDVRRIARETAAEVMADQGPAKIEHIVKLPSGENVIEDHVHPRFDDVLKMVCAGLNVLLVGPAGCGKSFLGRQIAEALKLPYSDLSLTAGTAEYQLTGRLLPTGDGGRFEYHPAPFVEIYENGGVFLMDELDAADPNMLVVVNSALANNGFTNEVRSDKPRVERHEDAHIIAAANTYGNGAEGLYSGRNALDGATINRFTIVEMDYDTELEKRLASTDILKWCWKIRDRIQTNELERIMSTRDIEKAGKMEAAGFSEDFIKNALLAGWSKDEIRQVGESE